DALARAQQAHDIKLLIQAQQILGSIVETNGEDIAAEGHYQAALSHAQEIGDDEQQITLMQSLGVLMGKRGNYDESIRYFAEGVVLARARNYPQAVCSLLIKLS